LVLAVFGDGDCGGGGGAAVGGGERSPAAPVPAAAAAAGAAGTQLGLGGRDQAQQQQRQGAASGAAEVEAAALLQLRMQVLAALLDLLSRAPEPIGLAVLCAAAPLLTPPLPAVVEIDRDQPAARYGTEDGPRIAGGSGSGGAGCSTVVQSGRHVSLVTQPSSCHMAPSGGGTTASETPARPCGGVRSMSTGGGGAAAAAVAAASAGGDRAAAAATPSAIRGDPPATADDGAVPEIERLLAAQHALRSAVQSA
ncbi:hypothetical protein PLESTF_000471100, partial [Pleodorina starrii]